MISRRFYLIFKSLLLIYLTCLVPFNGFGQREINNIYLFDCTGSMKNNNLWQPAQDALDATIMTQSAIPGTQFIIIPFGDTPYTTFTFGPSQYQGQKKDIKNEFDKDIKQAKYTRISDVLKAGFGKIDPNKENKIYLLTDGQPNNGDSPELVAKTIKEWCSNHRNTRLFYVALTQGVLNPTIKQAIDECPDAFVVQCENKVIPQIADISSDVYTNVQELSKPRAVDFSIPGNYPLTVTNNDPLFDVKVTNNQASSGKILLTLTPKNGHDVNSLHQQIQGGEHKFTVAIQSADKRFFIANPNLTVHVSDEIPSKLTIGNAQEEVRAEGVKWHDSFLWSDAAPDKKITWNLEPVFENQLAGSKLDLVFKTAEGFEHDYQAWYNGKNIKPGDIITIQPGEPALLEVQFNHDAKTGKRYFNLEPREYAGINMINDKPAENYEGTSLRTEYNVGWNPLKTFLFWLMIVIIIALILWFLIFRRIFFPQIKVGKIEFAGPGSYYGSKKLKGARKVVLTSKKKSQNILSRLFTGEIRYLRADHFSPEITITPAGAKKKVKLRSEQATANSWDFYPSSIFAQYQEGTITNRNTKEKSEIKLS